MRALSRFLLAIGIVILVCSSSYAALTAGQTYTIEIYAIQSNGTPASAASTSTTATANGDGKISFTLSNVPTNATANFILIKVKDNSGTVVRKCLAPAPAASGTNQVGVNDLTDTQTDSLLLGMASGASDDPIFVAFGLVLLRAPGITDADCQHIGQVGASAILGNNGFVHFLETDGGATAAQMATLRQKLIYNETANTIDLRTYAAQFKSAVDASSDSSATEFMAKAGGYLADMFVDAGAAAGIDLSLIIAANNAAGDVANASDDWNAVTASVKTTMDQAMSAFHMRLAAMKVKKEYRSALTALGASGEQVTRFDTAVNTLVTAFQNIDSTYGQYFSNPGTMSDEIQTAIDAAYMSAFSTFQSDIQSTVSDINSLKTAIAAAFGIEVGDLPGDFGTYTDFGLQTKRWPIPQTVAINWIASIIAANGSLTYTRDTLAVPGNMGWLNGNGTRSNFCGPMAALMGIREDCNIAECTRYFIYDGGQPSMAVQKAANLAFKENLAHIATLIGGTTNGSTSISSTQKEALVKLMLQPSMD